MPVLYIYCDRKSGNESPFQGKPQSKQDGDVKPPLQAWKEPQDLHEAAATNPMRHPRANPRVLELRPGQNSFLHGPTVLFTV